MADRSHKVAEVIALPGLPKGASESMRLRRDMAISLLCLKKGITLEQAARELTRILDQAMGAMDAALDETFRKNTAPER